MMITRDNYESFFLDFLEGKLKEDQIDQFLVFLEQNPDLKEELQLFDNAGLPEEIIVFDGKQHLYKTEDDEKALLDNKVVDYLEGNLSDFEKARFEAYLANHPELEKEYRLFVNSRLVPDLNIKFPNKKKLYRKSRSVVIMNWVASAAAVALLAMIVNSVIQSGDKISSVQPANMVAELKPASPSAASQSSIVKVISPSALVKPVTDKRIQKSVSEPTHEVTRQFTTIRSTKESLQEKVTEIAVHAVIRDSVELAPMEPIFAQLEPEPVTSELAVVKVSKSEKLNESPKVITLDEFLANRVKQVGEEGLLSVQGILRAGLNVASDISGKRFGYQTKNGKISRLGFESKLMAFSIPLTKKSNGL